MREDMARVLDGSASARASAGQLASTRPSRVARALACALAESSDFFGLLGEQSSPKCDIPCI